MTGNQIDPNQITQESNETSFPSHEEIVQRFFHEHEKTQSDLTKAMEKMENLAEIIQKLTDKVMRL